MAPEADDVEARVRRAFADFNRVVVEGDDAAIDSFLREHYTEDAEFDYSATTPDGGIFRGHDGFRAYMAGTRGAVQMQFDPFEILEVRPGVIVLAVRVSARGASTGIETSAEIAYLNRLAPDGRISSSRTFRTVAAARAAADDA